MLHFFYSNTKKDVRMNIKCACTLSHSRAHSLMHIMRCDFTVSGRFRQHPKAKAPKFYHFKSDQNFNDTINQFNTM